MSEEGLKIVGEIGSMSLKPDDVVIVRVKDMLSHEQAGYVRETIQPYFPDHKILVLSGNISLEVARKEQL